MDPFLASLLLFILVVCVAPSAIHWANGVRPDGHHGHRACCGTERAGDAGRVTREPSC